MNMHSVYGTEALTRIPGFYGNKRSSSKYAAITIRPGDRVQLIAPGGGGWGDPAERDRAAIAEDVREGYVSAECAARDYGFRLQGES